jgi:hypothetical protein
VSERMLITQGSGSLCAHGCQREATVQHADERLLCRACYEAEVGVSAGNPPCPTCHPLVAHNGDVWRRVSEGSARAECDCGWVGPKRSHEGGLAHEDLIHHFGQVDGADGMATGRDLATRRRNEEPASVSGDVDCTH